MASKLYPSLEEFYENDNIENGDEDIWYSVSDQKLYRTRKRANKSKDITDNILSHKNIIDEEEETNCVPTAPPLEEISWDDIEDLENHPDYSLLSDQSFLPPYSDHDPLQTNSWIDDLQPDYDDDSTTLADSGDLNILTIVSHEPKDTHRLRNALSGRQTESNSQTTHARKGKFRDSERKEQELPIKNSSRNHQERNGDDYMAWVTWRKQANRQLASLILLRRGDHVRLQTVDLSRKPLSKTSMKQVFQKATNDSSKETTTSLNGKPYIMYGIPRVALAKSPITQ